MEDDLSKGAYTVSAGKKYVCKQCKHANSKGPKGLCIPTLKCLIRDSVICFLKYTFANALFLKYFIHNEELHVFSSSLTFNSLA